MNLHQTLPYLDVDPEFTFKKKKHFQGKSTYTKNRSHIRSLIDSGFILYNGADEDNFLNVVEANPNIFTLNIINFVEKDKEPEQHK